MIDKADLTDLAATAKSARESLIEYVFAHHSIPRPFNRTLSKVMDSLQILEERLSELAK